MAFKPLFKDGKWPFGGKGQPDSVPIPKGAACFKINDILSSADAGEYSIGGLAKTLPCTPGIFVKDVGIVSFPLVPHQAETLIEYCENSPFGHNPDTTMDESVRKSWQLHPDQLEVQHPWWQSGVEKLTEIIVGRLGYKGLYKLLVYGEGGHFSKHQDTEKEDGMIATLVVQPPSVHEGGDLIVYRNGVKEHRHDFGKIEGTAAYFTHYVVHYSDSEHALEEVTKGYRIALVYSICSPATMRHLERDPNKPVSAELAVAINSMGPEDYTKKSIKDMGSRAVKGIGSTRFQLLEGANALVPADKKLRFFIAKLVVKIANALEDEGRTNRSHEEAFHWYTIVEQDLGR
ncbi:hypothetical protein PHMEG_00015245 [Phytophthora megakarya]|uniref:Fe2OG dioxygenase domain-containing protein n=1 Tax=Phytophthora megakarya TaxID=4795 RepID=A0A225W4D5_9STRA|nr:hypothetical protein PHMEG_00015245 [Phytophthora megakarya]